MDKDKFIQWLDQQMQQFSAREESAKRNKDKMEELVCHAKISSMLLIKDKVESGDFE